MKKMYIYLEAYLTNFINSFFFIQRNGGKDNSFCTQLEKAEFNL